MIGNIIYRESLKRVSTQVPINDGTVLVTGATGLIGSCIIDLLMIANEQGRHFDIFALGRNETKLRNRFNAYRGSNLLHFSMITLYMEPVMRILEIMQHTLQKLCL